MRVRCLYRNTVLFFVILFVSLVCFLHPDLHARRSYEYIEKEDILKELHEEIAENFTSSSLGNCDYNDVIRDDTVLSINLVDGDLIEGHQIKEGGEYAPSYCKPKYSTAIIVPYRDRAEELRGFLVYMHTFFHHQHIHYRIYVIEQVDSKPFNRGKLLNIGAVAAMKAGYPCLILHDVDLLPLKPANLYACTESPRHMSSSINKYRFVLPYLNFYEGVIAILSKQYKKINGMSNFLDLHEDDDDDDDLCSRLHAHDLEFCRFEPDTSQYHQVKHRYDTRIEFRRTSPDSFKENSKVDGLTSLKYSEIATVLHPLFTHIMVEL